MSAQVSKLKLFKTETIWDLIVNFSVKKEPKYCSAVDCHFFYHLFFNKCMFVQYIHLHGQTVQITNTAKKQHGIVPN